MGPLCMGPLWIWSHLDESPLDGSPLDGPPLDGSPLNGSPLDVSSLDWSPLDGSSLDWSPLDGSPMDASLLHPYPPPLPRASFTSWIPGLILYCCEEKSIRRKHCTYPRTQLPQPRLDRHQLIRIIFLEAQLTTLVS